MKYTIEGKNLPVLICELDENETIVSEGGAMSWMSPNMEMKTSTRGGFKKAFGRSLSGERAFQNIYRAKKGPATIAFASKFPGTIISYDVFYGNEIIVQKSSFIASEEGVDASVYFQEKLSTAMFGGEGFIMQKLSGNGKAFLEIDGDIKIYDLMPGEEIIIDTGHLAAMSRTCSMDIKKISGVKNVLFGGEGLFNTIVRGPGKVYLQTMPISKLRALFTMDE